MYVRVWTFHWFFCWFISVLLSQLLAHIIGSLCVYLKDRNSEVDFSFQLLTANFHMWGPFEVFLSYFALFKLMPRSPSLFVFQRLNNASLSRRRGTVPTVWAETLWEIPPESACTAMTPHFWREKHCDWWYYSSNKNGLCNIWQREDKILHLQVRR